MLLVYCCQARIYVAIKKRSNPSALLAVQNATIANDGPGACKSIPVYIHKLQRQLKHNYFVDNSLI